MFLNKLAILRALQLFTEGQARLMLERCGRNGLVKAVHLSGVLDGEGQFIPATDVGQQVDRAVRGCFDCPLRNPSNRLRVVSRARRDYLAQLSAG